MFELAFADFNLRALQAQAGYLGLLVAIVTGAALVLWAGVAGGVWNLCAMHPRPHRPHHP